MNAQTASGLVFIAAAFALGCPKPGPQPQPPVVDTGAPPDCPLDTNPPADAVCDGLFAPDGTACVACVTAYGCIDRAHAVYCVAKGGCLLDSTCGAAK